MPRGLYLPVVPLIHPTAPSQPENKTETKTKKQKQKPKIKNKQQNQKTKTNNKIKKQKQNKNKNKKTKQKQKKQKKGQSAVVDVAHLAPGARFCFLFLFCFVVVALLSFLFSQSRFGAVFLNAAFRLPLLPLYNGGGKCFFFFTPQNTTDGPKCPVGFIFLLFL
jgi:uncharacterized membrane protein